MSVSGSVLTTRSKGSPSTRQPAPDRTSVRHAYVVFDHHYAARRKTALGWLEERGILPLGRFGRFEYDNSDQCVIKSRALARTLLERAAKGS